MESYSDFFRRMSGGPNELGPAPHSWQNALGSDALCRDRLLRVPTGFGKTAGTVLPWLYHRVVRGDRSWPTRLAFCLPMRVLVEQTEASVRAWVERLGAHVGVHVLLGGVEAERWELDPETPAILLGTQDMLLSRALNRGFGSGRARWPLSFGLLNHDTLWVLDEVQLMDTGLATSAQLAAFRAEDARSRASFRPSPTWWMSATLQPSWLGTVDHAESARALAEGMTRIAPAERSGGLWEVEKALTHAEEVLAEADVARLVREQHQAGTLSLVVVNQVARAVEVARLLRDAWHEGKGAKRRLRPDAPDLRLVHSRFRGEERARWREAFLHRDAPPPVAGRIVVATQVVEAGVDISARLLVTDLAPWSSLVQRFGRCARYASPSPESGAVVVLGMPKNELPYERAALAAAAEAIRTLASTRRDVAPRSLESFEESLEPEERARLYPYDPPHVLRRRDLDELFDTTPDLTGADLDVSRYIRSGEERDLRVFWRALEADRRSLDRTVVGEVHREELCPVPLAELRAWIREDRKGRTPFVLDYLTGTWVRQPDLQRLVPGMTVLLPATAGGYDADLGWQPKSHTPVAPVARSEAPPLDPAAQRFTEAAEAEEDDSLSRADGWKSIATHGWETGHVAGTLAQALGLPDALERVLRLAGRWHDAGKAHPVFQAAIVGPSRPMCGADPRVDLAKAPDGAWRRPPYPERPGFRHELASTLALLELLRRSEPEHAALLGPHAEALEALGVEAPEHTAADDVARTHPLAGEIRALDAEELNLLLFLVCAHHGKVRTAWTGTPSDQRAGRGDVHGVRGGDALPHLTLATADGADAVLPALTLSLDAAALGISARYGASWRDRVASLQEHYGPFALAYAEAILRAADVQASRLATLDPRL